jgi:hypothetical protein
LKKIVLYVSFETLMSQYFLTSLMLRIEWEYYVQETKFCNNIKAIINAIFLLQPISYLDVRLHLFVWINLNKKKHILLATNMDLKRDVATSKCTSSHVYCFFYHAFVYKQDVFPLKVVFKKPMTYASGFFLHYSLLCFHIKLVPVDY